jgi:hypothetical protein
MSARIDITGLRFGRLTVVGFDHLRGKGKRAIWLCKCDCGKDRLVQGNHLRGGLSKSCGCLAKETTSKIKRKHGHTVSGGNKTPEYKAWIAIKTRCYKVDGVDYKNYGARGIIVCDRWLNSFENFIEDMGLKPSEKHSVDRINNDGNYEPANCKWSTHSEQMKNRRPFSRNRAASGQYA